MSEKWIAVFGGSSNRVAIRRRRDGEVLNELHIAGTIDSEKTTPFLLEITVGGEIVLYSSQYRDRPLIMTHDSNPLPVRYISFGVYVDYFYNCKKDAAFKVVPRHPLLNTDLLTKVDVDNSKSTHCLCLRP